MLGFTQIGSGIAALVIGLILFFASDRLVAYELISGDFNVMDGGGVGESSGAAVTTFYPGDSGAHCRLPGRWTIFPKRAYQPGFLHGDADGLAFPRQRSGW